MIVMIRSYINKLLRSPFTYAAFAGIIAVCCFRIFAPNRNSTVIGQLMLFYGWTIMRKVVYIFAALPFAGNFADEWTNSVTTNCVTRCGLKKYIISNAIVCFVSSTVLVFLGIMLFAWVYSFFIPVYIDVGNPNNPPYGVFLDAGLPFLTIAFEAFVFAASCGFWSITGMTVSAFFPNKYVAICVPVAANFFFERFTRRFPTEINLKGVALSRLFWNNVAGQFFYSIGFFVLLSVLFTLLFALSVKRRVQNEVT